MNAELGRLINALIEGNNCYQCGTPFLIEASELDAEGDGIYTSNYPCPECEAEYAITVEDEKALLVLEYSRTDDNAPEEPITPFQSRRKEALQQQTHPVKDLVEGYTELNAALTLLWQNRKRIIEACDTLRENGIDMRDEEFQRRVHADIHNYVASAYSFEIIRKNVESNLPTDGPVVDAVSLYEEEKKVVMGLRVYAQKQFTIPFSYATFAGEGVDEYETTIGVQLEEVNVIESDVEWSPPDGYRKGADHHYGDVEGEYINVERRVNLHYEAAEEMVGAIAEYAEEVHADELEDYRESTRFDAGRR